MTFFLNSALTLIVLLPLSVHFPSGTAYGSAQPISGLKTLSCAGKLC